MKTISVYRKGKFEKVEYVRKFNFNGYDVYVAPRFSVMAGIGFRRKNMIFAEKIIIVNKLFMELSKVNKLFVLYHEIGHDKCNHFDKDIVGRDVSLEIEADIYSANILVNEYGVCEQDMPEILYNTLAYTRTSVSVEVSTRYEAMIEAVR